MSSSQMIGPVCCLSCSHQCGLVSTTVHYWRSHGGFEGSMQPGGRAMESPNALLLLVCVGDFPLQTGQKGNLEKPLTTFSVDPEEEDFSFKHLPTH